MKLKKYILINGEPVEVLTEGPGLAMDYEWPKPKPGESSRDPEFSEGQDSGPAKKSPPRAS